MISRCGYPVVVSSPSGRNILVACRDLTLVHDNRGNPAVEDEATITILARGQQDSGGGGCEQLLLKAVGQGLCGLDML